ncbi:MAG: GNAT family N-acetyltransferase [Verrucomicrobiales bacterium]
MFYYDRLSPESITGPQLDGWLALGGYRMHQDMFTTSHVDLGEIYRVYWLRFDVRTLRDHRSHRRLRHRNGSFTSRIEPFSGIGVDHHLLHQKYRDSIDFDGAPTIAECLFGDDPDKINNFQTHCLSVYDRETLIAGGYFDTGHTSAASILHYYDPDYRRHSLGKHLILLTIDYLKAMGYRWYYPGYVVQGCPKMNYKLFLGQEHAHYFDPRARQWKPLHSTLLIGQPHSLESLIAEHVARRDQTDPTPPPTLQPKATDATDDPDFRPPDDQSSEGSIPS